METNRRNFLRTAAFGAVAMAAIPEIVSAAIPLINKKKQKSILPNLKPGDVILFQGDSITDAGRERMKQLSNNGSSFGTGYTYLAASKLLSEYPDKDFSIFNRGVSGNKVFQMADRWQRDCFDLMPSVLSVLIGVNDFWHTLDGKYTGTVEKYETDYRQLLSLTKKMLPHVRLIIGEPYAVQGASAVNEKWFPAFDGYRAVAKKMAEEFDAVFIPYQTVYDEAVLKAPAKYWTPDGVHPSMAGCALMAEAWLAAAK
jgi:lysophospholipase L1-like esterase